MASDSHLRYLDADRIETPLPNLSAADVLDRHGRRLGSVDGVVVDPARRKAVYLVIRRDDLVRSRRRLLPFEDIHVDAASAVLRVDSDATTFEDFEARDYPAFSDDDLLTALFAHRAA